MIPIMLIFFLLISFPVSAIDPSQSVVTVQSRQGQGTGFFINSRGFLLTNEHVTGGQAQVDIQTATGEYFKGTLYYFDSHLDLALYRIDAINTPALPLDTSGKIPEGEEVYSIGSPLGVEQYENSGILRDTVTRQNQSYLRVAMKSFPGISGSPLFTDEGQVIGVNTLSSGDYTLALPIEEAVGFLKARGVEFIATDLQKLSPAATKPPRQITWERFGSYLLLWNFILFLLHIGLGIYNFRVRRGLFQPHYSDGDPVEEEDQEDDSYTPPR